MKVGDIVEFRCPDVFMEKKFTIRGVGIIIDERKVNALKKATCFARLPLKFNGLAAKLAGNTEPTWRSYESR